MQKAGIVLILWMLCNTCRADSVFERVAGIHDTGIQQVERSKTDPSMIVASSANSLYLSRDSGGRFDRIESLTDEQISHFCIAPDTTSAIYVAGSRHCYRVKENTRRIFSAAPEETINFIALHDNRLYIATSTGLHHAEQYRLDWQEVPGFSGTEVYSIEGVGSDIYVASESGVYRFRPGDAPRRLFATHRNENGLQPWLVKTDINISNRLWLCSSRGIFHSDNRGMEWKKLSTAGLDHLAVHHIAQSGQDGSVLYACSEAGLFKVNIATGSSNALYEGLSTTGTKWIDVSSNGEIYLATDTGLFRSRTKSSAKFDEHIAIMMREPSIHAMQVAALRYNEVHPEKIGLWRNRLKYRALMPRISFDYDNNIGSSFTKDQYYFARGPHKWGVSASWDIGNLIWNSYEDDIDNRSRLTTQLRLDILDQVNRVYFERLRLKQEISGTNPGSQERFEKTLRLQELTATLDGYTGGYFTRKRIGF